MDLERERKRLSEREGRGCRIWFFDQSFFVFVGDDEPKKASRV